MSDGSILPVMRYADFAGAARWLCRAFGFAIHHMARGDDGVLAYVVLRYGDDLVLVGPHDGSVLDDLMVQPVDVGNRSTQTCYLTVGDVDEHCAQSKQAGALVEIEPCDDEEGGRFYVCRDPEGHIWSFGNPSPDANLTIPDRSVEAHREPSSARGRVAVSLAILVGLAIGGSTVLYLGADSSPQAMASWIGAAAGPEQSQAAVASSPPERERRLEAERLAAFATKRLVEAEAATAELTRKFEASQVQLQQALRQKEAAEHSLKASEAAHLQRLIEHRKALDATALARDQASRELEAQRQRAVVIEKALYDAARRLTDAQGSGAELTQEMHQLRVEMARLQDAKSSSDEAAELARNRLAAARTTEVDLKEKLGAAERELAAVQSKATELEAELKNVRLQAEQSAETARRELAAAQASERTLREKLSEIEADFEELQASRGTQRPSLASLSEPKSETATIPKALESVAHLPCSQAVRDIVFRNHPGTEAWQVHVVKRLCEGAYETQEPAKCLGQLLSGKVNWGGSTRWKASNAVSLCAGTPSATATIACFSRRVAAKESWQSAIGACASFY